MENKVKKSRNKKEERMEEEEKVIELEMENELEKLNNDLNTLKRNKENSSKDAEEKKAEIDNIISTLSQAEDDRKALTEELEELSAEKEKQSGSHKGFIDKREEYSEKIILFGRR